MLAISVEKPHSLAVVEASSPAPEQGEVRIRVRRAGICGSDVHILHGSNPFARYPRIVGHEFAGEIESVGPDVSALAVGDRVVVDPVLSCGHCYPCRIGRPNVCANLEVLGVHRDGGFRDLIVVPARNVVKVSPSLPIEIAALAEPFSIAANVLSRTGCGPEDTVLIYGAGTVGLTVLQVAKLKGARCIVADIDTARLERAPALGAAPGRRGGGRGRGGGGGGGGGVGKGGGGGGRGRRRAGARRWSSMALACLPCCWR